MRKNMETKQEELNLRKRDVLGENHSLKAKLESLKQLEKEVYDKLINLEEKSQQKYSTLETEFLGKNKDRMDLESNNKLTDLKIKEELKTNQELEFYLTNNAEIDKNIQINFEKEMSSTENLIAEKTKKYEDVNSKMKDFETKLCEDPFYKTEIEKNATFKRKIKDAEKDTLETNTIVECLELQNEFLTNKKEQVIIDRKKLINQNDELKHEIEAKTQLNEIRIQKKMKDNHSEDLKNMEKHLKFVNESIADLEAKVEKEIEKSKMLNIEIMKNTIEYGHRQEKMKNLEVTTQEKEGQISELKSNFEDCKNEHNNLKDRVCFFTFS